jgi:hypothetical protein
VSTKDGGPAFPVHNNSQGMSLRDYFAAKAMQAGMVNASLPGLHERNPQMVDMVEKAARAFYTVADAMLKAREQ